MEHNLSNISLVQYNPPVVVQPNGDNRGGHKASTPSTRITKKGASQNKNRDLKDSNDRIDYLNTILPPIRWVEDGKQYEITASTAPPKLSYILNLEETTQKLLVEMRAKEIGICPIREHIFSECFKELVRQESIVCLERGALLFRVRSELYNQIKEYKKIYESSVVYTARKTWNAQAREKELTQGIDELIVNNENIRENIKALNKVLQTHGRNSEAQMEEEERLHKEKIEEHRMKLNQIKADLGTLYGVNVEKPS